MGFTIFVVAVILSNDRTQSEQYTNLHLPRSSRTRPEHCRLCLWLRCACVPDQVSLARILCVGQSAATAPVASNSPHRFQWNAKNSSITDDKPTPTPSQSAGTRSRIVPIKDTTPRPQHGRLRRRVAATDVEDRDRSETVYLPDLPPPAATACPSEVGGNQGLFASGAK
ncbi:hypothetical protein NCC49_004786 [Naganishia albida]|nr:hypothetical protein NCC49_004786 [Naganishia albida]